MQVQVAPTAGRSGKTVFRVIEFSTVHHDMEHTCAACWGCGSILLNDKPPFNEVACPARSGRAA